jgi:hypothetical protein
MIPVPPRKVVKVVLSDEMKRYFSELGRRGGMAGKGKPKKRDPEECRLNAIKASRARWDKVKGV